MTAVPVKMAALPFPVKMAEVPAKIAALTVSSHPHLPGIWTCCPQADEVTTFFPIVPRCDGESFISFQFSKQFVQWQIKLQITCP
jgi:hypothetical protein